VSGAGRIRVALVDDDATVRAGVASILCSDPVLEIVGEAQDGTEAVELVRRRRPDVVLLDIRMPGGRRSRCTASDPGGGTGDRGPP
jgi:DNA-binding NarL/FixJ family response regulator